MIQSHNIFMQNPEEDSKEPSQGDREVSHVDAHEPEPNSTPNAPSAANRKIRRRKQPNPSKLNIPLATQYYQKV